MTFILNLMLIIPWYCATHNNIPAPSYLPSATYIGTPLGRMCSCIKLAIVRSHTQLFWGRECVPRGMFLLTLVPRSILKATSSVLQASVSLLPACPRTCDPCVTCGLGLRASENLHMCPDHTKNGLSSSPALWTRSPTYLGRCPSLRLFAVRKGNLLVS
jgi:hypothetical protein